MTDVIELLESTPGWQKGVNRSSSQAREALHEKIGVSLPESYQQFLSSSDGGVLTCGQTHVNFWTVHKLTQMNPDERWSENIPGIIVFATNEASFIYFFDPKDVLEQGSWAVFSANMGSVLPKFSILIATDFASFVQRAIRGEDLISGPYLSDA